MGDTADVVIIGGGIQGVSAAYHLFKAGLKNVRLIEKEEYLGVGITRYSAGWFVLQAGLEQNVQLSQLSLQEYKQFNETFGVNIDFDQVGSLWVNVIDCKSEMQEKAKFYEKLGVPIEELDADGVRLLAPCLNLSDIGIGLFCKDDGKLLANVVIDAYAKPLKDKITREVEAIDIIVKNGRVKAVKTTHGTIETPIVVNAAGIFDRKVAGWIDIDLPTYRARRYTITTEPIKTEQSFLIPETLVQVLKPEAVYLSRDSESIAYSVGLEELKHDDKSDEQNHLDNIKGKELEIILEKYRIALNHRIPEIFKLGIKIMQGGLRSIPRATLSGKSEYEERQLPQVGLSLPLLGPVDGIEGYINDCGWGGLGVSHAPAGGILIAEYVTKGKFTSINIDPFLLSRYRKKT